jgi:vitamin B12 transporter
MTRLAAFLASLLLSVSTASADGALTGTVRTPAGEPVPQLVLVVTGPDGARRVVTGAEGRYRAETLRPGEYTVAPDAPGFDLSPEPRTSVATGDTRLDLVLAPAPVRERVVVAATRDEAALSTLGVSADSLERDEIEERASSDVLHLLQETPGTSVARAGGVGLQASTFVRGGNSNFARVIVDGVPANEPGGAYNFGSLLPLELERIEVVRGAASSLYGTDALAGVIHLVTRRAAPGEAPSFRAEADGGSFAWRRGVVGTSGQRGRLDWNVGLLRLETDNEQPNSELRETAWAAALGGRLDARSSLRVVFRGEDAEVGTPGQTLYGRPDLDASIGRQAMVLAAELGHVRDRVTHEVHGGLARARQLSRNPLDSGAYTPRYLGLTGAFPLSDFPDPAGFQNDTDRLTLGYRAEAQAGTRHLLTAGVEVERESGELGSRSGDLITPERTNLGAYLQDRIAWGGRLFLTMGGRVEHNDSFGTRAVPRAALAWRVRGGDAPTTLKASGGAGIKEPSFFESFGVSFFARGNPDLKPERSRTFDVGVEQRWGGRLRAQATAFRHDYLDQIAFQVLDFTTFEGTYTNLGESRAQGIELSLEAAPHPALRVSADYTFLDSEVLVSTADFDPVYAVGRSLLRRPRHQGAVSGRVGGERGAVLATVVAVGARADSDFAGLGLTENDGYTRVDVRGHLRLVRGLTLFAVAENLLDREYQEVLGYPALGRSVRAGLRFRTADR